MSNNELATVLWDIPLDQRENLPVSFLIQRVLQYGGMTLLVAALRTYGRESLRAEFEAMKQLSFEPRRFYYLKNFFLAET